ncbi:MAG: C40 family peptidase [Porticoccaceae bacterium]|jgi:cell wall-associated NlpC family hydrolase|nr:C40 family peptidase [Porticoccaceae bacterium]
MIDPQRIISAARETMGTPFHHQGRVVGVGMDCAGVLVHVLKSLGLPIIDERGYPRFPYRGLIKSILDSQPSLLPIDKREMVTGDVLLMRITREPQHVAIYTGATIVHAYSTAGGVVEHSLSPEWRGRIMGVYRIVEPAA